VKRSTLSLACIVLLSAAVLHAQNAPAAPVPAQILTAKIIFLAKAPSNIGLSDAYLAPGYNTMYHELSATNHYQMATTPAAADLSFEYSAKVAAGVSSGDSNGPAYVELVIRDAKTQALLWTITEPLKGFALREKAVQKVIDETTVKLAADLATLTTPGSAAGNAAAVVPDQSVETPPCSTVPVPAPKKTRLQQSK
jgi:hypothetical protein